MPADLQCRWTTLITTATNEHAIGAFEAITAAYERPPRHYHTIDHVADCLTRLDEHRDLAHNPDAVELALWFHDIIYDATRTDNEAKSAYLAHRVCARLSIPDIDTIRDLVLATRHTGELLEADAALIVDIDLAILGADATTYDAYAAAIRREYDHVDDDAYTKGRAIFLESMLARDHIYTLTPFRDRDETTARANIEREIAQLQSRTQ